MIPEFDDARFPLKDELASVLEFVCFVSLLGSEENNFEELGSFRSSVRGNVPSACMLLVVSGGLVCGVVEVMLVLKICSGVTAC